MFGASRTGVCFISFTTFSMTERSFIIRTDSADRTVFLGDRLSITCGQEFVGEPGDACERCGKKFGLVAIERLADNGGWAHVLTLCEDDYPELVRLVGRVAGFLVETNETKGR